jgi:hypothetical protein
VPQYVIIGVGGVKYLETVNGHWQRVYESAHPHNIVLLDILQHDFESNLAFSDHGNASN